MAKVILVEEGSTPSTPSAGKWVIYPKSDGFYTLDDAGAETGPFGVGGSEGLMFWDEGIPQATGTILNVVGANASLSVSGTVANLIVTPPEGTAVLSTGETGGTKFLREDGDDSCSWQTVSSGGLTPTADSADSNVAYSAGNEYNVTMGGFSANRNRTIPVASAAGEEIRINILDGDADYALIILGVATVTINGGSAATEWSRLFIGGETVTLRSTSTTNWHVVEDGRIPCICKLTNGTAQTFANNTPTICDFDTAELDNASIADLANEKITLRRAGAYQITAALAFVLNDQDKITVWIQVNGTSSARFDAYLSYTGVSTIVVQRDDVFELTAGGYIEMQGLHTYGANADTLTNIHSKPKLVVKELFV